MCFSIFCQVNSQNSTATEDWKNGSGGGRPSQKDDGKAGPNQTDMWEGVEDVPANAAIGHIHLSFEYHKSNLKIRVWQVSDLLLPPPQTSMIESIFVRSYLIPDLVKKTNRKTEDVRVDVSSKDISKQAHAQTKSGIQHVFTPSTFRFDTPLQYTSVTQDIVAERSVQIEVCMTQKHTHKPFLIAMVHMPLKTAVRRPIRQKYPLIPCMNYTIPNNMRVYSAREVFEEDSYQHSMGYSRSNSSHSNSDFNSVDVPLDSVESESPVRKFISVDISNSDSDEDKDEDNDDDVDDGIGSSVDVKICSGKESASPSVNVDMIEYGIDELETPGQLMQVLSHKTPESGKDTAVVEIADSLPESSRPKKKIIPNEIFKKSSEAPAESEPVSSSSVIEIEEEPKSTVVDMSKLQRDIVLDVESHDDDDERYADLPQEKDHTAEKIPKRKKKIIPFESDISQNQLDEAGHGGGEGEDNSVLNDHKIISPKLTISDEACNSLSEPGNEDGENAEDDVEREIESARLQSCSSEMSGKSKGSTPTPNSRPETPIWDYYDFACDEQAEGDAKSGENAEASPSSDSTSKTETTKATSTLQESLARLSRPSTTLDTCRVAGPVLPSVIVDDFEMDED